MAGVGDSNDFEGSAPSDANSDFGGSVFRKNSFADPSEAVGGTTYTEHPTKKNGAEDQPLLEKNEGDLKSTNLQGSAETHHERGLPPVPPVPPVPSKDVTDDATSEDEEEGTHNMQQAARARVAVDKSPVIHIDVVTDAISEDKGASANKTQRAAQTSAVVNKSPVIDRRNAKKNNQSIIYVYDPTDGTLIEAFKGIFDQTKAIVKPINATDGLIDNRRERKLKHGDDVAVDYAIIVVTSGQGRKNFFGGDRLSSVKDLMDAGLHVFFVLFSADPLVNRVPLLLPEDEFKDRYGQLVEESFREYTKDEAWRHVEFIGVSGRKGVSGNQFSNYLTELKVCMRSGKLAELGALSRASNIVPNNVAEELDKTWLELRRMRKILLPQ